MELYGFSIEVLLFLLAAASIAGFLDTLAGGGGLIALPALIVSGIAPLSALGTNKLQGTMGTATATFIMLRTRRVKWRDVRLLMVAAFIGSMSGAVAVQFIDTRVLHFMIPMVLLMIAVYFLFSPMPKEGSGRASVSEKVYRRVIVPVIGCYDGIFGPGTGSFLALAGVSCRGLGLIDATAVAKTLNFSTNFASLVIFIAAGKVVWIAGLIMMAGQFLGAWAGSYCLLRINPKFLRIVVVCMCMGMLAKYLYSQS